ncbi:MAG: YkgJ family cysteine cluster protein [Desulfobacterales bacterium]
MTDPHSTAGVEPVRITLKSRFKFHCHPGVSCFTLCCRGINIILTPYDIIRLKNRLGMDSEEFLAVYTEPRLLEKTDLPVVSLKLLDDDRQSCPFVRDDGCIVYADRPTACRYYPLGVASLSHRETGPGDAGENDGEGFYFFVNEPHCKGFEENRLWTVEAYRKDQGVDIHDEINAEWTDLVVRKRSFPQNVQLSEKSKQMFFTASYNIDQFRRFVFDSSFLNRYRVDPATVDRIREDEVALLDFGLTWLKFVLFKIGGFQMRSDEDSGH